MELGDGKRFPKPDLPAALSAVYPGLNVQQLNAVSDKLQEILVTGIGQGKHLALAEELQDGKIDVEFFTLKEVVDDLLRQPRRS